MKIPIDVVFLDGQFAVVKLVENMRPWRFGRTVAMAKHVLEMHAGTVKALGIKKGMRLDFIG
jgi:uncharacterized membrane protein (UPF0127 family)